MAEQQTSTIRDIHYHLSKVNMVLCGIREGCGFDVFVAVTANLDKLQYCRIHPLAIILQPGLSSGDIILASGGSWV